MPPPSVLDLGEITADLEREGRAGLHDSYYQLLEHIESKVPEHASAPG
jgi:hypothetical protein